MPKSHLSVIKLAQPIRSLKAVAAAGMASRATRSSGPFGVSSDGGLREAGQGFIGGGAPRVQRAGARRLWKGASPATSLALQAALHAPVLNCIVLGEISALCLERPSFEPERGQFGGATRRRRWNC